MWHKKNSKVIDDITILEPTIRQFMDLKTALDTDNMSMLQDIIGALAGEEVFLTADVINGVVEMALENPIKSSNADDEPPEMSWDIAILQEVDVVAGYYKLDPYYIIDHYTYRQLKYFIWAIINNNIRETEKTALLQGAELKKKPNFLRLKEPDGLGTAGMDKKEIAAYWRAKKHGK